MTGLARLGLGLVVVGALAGCSQAAALAPPEGKGLAEVRFAANDVLLSAGVGMVTVPVCVEVDSTHASCHGSTTNQQGISVESTTINPDLQTMTVEVGGRTIFKGSVQDVLAADNRSAP